MTRRAVILLNLGGPDRPEAVAPFLLNLFRDPAIIALPNPLRSVVARLIARRRTPEAQAIYERLGGGSPLLANTKAQATALADLLGSNYRVFIAMRHWHPLSEETVREVKAWSPDEVMLVPLYPQYSSTTTGSSIRAWRRAARSAGLVVPTFTLCCYPTDPGFVSAMAAGLRQALRTHPDGWPVRVLFSAHGLPQRIVDRGDPYQLQVEATVAAVVEAVGQPGLDAVLCYQSRVGSLEWLGPSIDAEIERAGAKGLALVVVPVAFVSEHSETLVELDMLYRSRAAVAGVPSFIRVATVGTHGDFIAGLARLIRRLAQSGSTLASAQGGRACPDICTRCAFSASGIGVSGGARS